MAGNTDDGYIALTSAEYYTIYQRELEAEAAKQGLRAPLWTPAEFVTIVGRFLAQRLGEVDKAAETLGDAYSPNNASLGLLRAIADIAGVAPFGGAKSRVVGTMTAWVRGSVLLSKGTKASDGSTTWVLIEDVVVPAGGSATGVFEAEDVGAIRCDAGTLTQKVTGVAGWETVTNVADATPGSAADTEDLIHYKISNGLGGYGSNSSLSLKAALERIPGIRSARVHYNDSFENVTVSGRTVAPNTLAIWVYPPEQTAETQREVLNAIFAKVGGDWGYSAPTSTGVDGFVGHTITANGQRHTIGVWYAQETAVRVRVRISAANGYEPGGNLALVSAPVRKVVESYFALLDQGSPIRLDDLKGDIARVSGVARTTTEVSTDGGSTWGTADILTAAGEFPVLDPSVPLASAVLVEEVA